MCILALCAAVVLASSPVEQSTVPAAGQISVALAPASTSAVSPQIPTTTVTPLPSQLQQPPQPPVAPPPSAPPQPPLSTDQPLPADNKTTGATLDHAGDHAGDHADIVVRAEARTIPGDPLQQLNLKAFKAVQAVDRAVIRPAAMAYSHIVPNPIRSGLRNFLNHLTEPVVFVNYLLQLKPGKAAETFGRFAINSTVGVAGVFDIAKRRPFKLPHRPNGFAYTMGYYGVKPGPFLFLPLVGPTTVRDLIGVILDRAFVPFAVGKPFNRPAYTIPTNVFGQLDQRAQLDATLDKLHAQSGRPYGASREDYLERRQAEIDVLRGKRNDVDETVPDVAKVPHK